MNKKKKTTFKALNVANKREGKRGRELQLLLCFQYVFSWSEQGVGVIHLTVLDINGIDASLDVLWWRKGQRRGGE